MRNVIIVLIGFVLASITVKLPFEVMPDVITAYRVSYVSVAILFSALLFCISTLGDEILR